MQGVLRGVVHHPRFLCLLLVCSFVSIESALAQGSGGIDMMGNGGRHSIQGRIYFPSGLRADVRIKVRLRSVQHGELSVLADLNGTFSFKSLLPGTYTVVIEGGEAFEDTTDTVFVDSDVGNPRIGIRLPKVARAYQVQIHLQPKRVAPNKGGVVNAELAALPERARMLYEKALEFGKEGETEKAISQLKEAISHYPQFVLALNELGVQYLKQGKPQSASEVLASAVQLRPEAFTLRLNYGIALLQNKKFADAEIQLTRALTRNGDSATAHLYLGISLVQLARYEEAEKALTRAVSLAGAGLNIAQAHYYLGGIYWRKREYKQAADELETYLKESPNAPNAAKVRATILDLRARS